MKNEDNFRNLYLSIHSKMSYKVVLGLMEGVAIFIIILSLDISDSYLKILFIPLFIIQFILLIDQMVYVCTKNISSSDVWWYLDIVSSIIIMSILAMLLINSKEVFFMSFSENNQSFRRILGILVTIKSFRFYSLIMQHDTINGILYGNYKSLGFLLDIMQVILLLFFIYGSIGIYLFGGSIHSNSNKLY